MLHGLKLDILNKHLSLLKKAQSGKDGFPSDLCNFLVIEFDFKESLIFDIQGENKLYLLGKSSYAGAEFVPGNYYDCNVCKDAANNNIININANYNCNIGFSNSPTDVSCVVFKTENEKNILVKFTRKVHFTEADESALKNIAEIVENYLTLWFTARDNVSFIQSPRYPEIIGKSLSELINSLNKVLGNSSLVLGTELQSNQQKYLTEIKNSTRNILSEIEYLKTLNEIESKGPEKNEIKEINLLQLLDEIKSNSGLRFNIKSTAGNPVLRNDPKKIKHILKAILTNLSETKTHENAELVLSGTSKGISLKIEYGQTESEKVINNLISYFSPVNVINGDSPTNSAMLFLAAKYAEDTQTSVVKEQNAKDGSVFSIYFANLTTAKDESPESSTETKTEKRKVLVVGNDYATSKLLNKYLDKWNYNPVTVNNVSEIFTKLDSEDFLAVILDIEQKDENSVELIRKIKNHEKAKGLPVIVCSVEPENEEAFVIGAIEYLTKPINYNNLVEILTSYKFTKDSNVLCVDDDIPTLNLVKQAIETAGFNAIAEFRSDKVMELISGMSLDLAIIDLDMPRLNGYELIKLIKSNPKFTELPIIIYTGKEDFDDELKSVEGLFSYLLSKNSVGMKDLENAIRNMIEGTVSVPEQKKYESGIKILLAEDYKHSQIIVTRLLKRNNFSNVVVVENGQEALDYVRKEKVDLILMDMQMPVMNGFEAIERIREIPEYRETPIISITAFAMKGDREKCLEAGATDYLPKPLDSKEFIEKIKYYSGSLVK